MPTRQIFREDEKLLLVYIYINKINFSMNNSIHLNNNLFGFVDRN